MKRIAASVGLVALGASALQAVDTSGSSSMQTTKPWSVSASLRGFYDDNINSTKVNKEKAYGLEVNPSVGVGANWDQTSVDLGYSYSGKFYDSRPLGSSDKWDHTHIFDAGLRHAFSPRLQLTLRDSFAVGQEPDVLRAGNEPLATFQRISGSNYRNYGVALLNVDVTPLLGFEVGYGNAWYNYEDSGFVNDGAGFIGASRSGLLDRMEHSAHIDSRWHFRPETTGIVGYRYGQTLYTGDEPIQGPFAGAPSPANLFSNNRDNRSHAIYAGAEHAFTPNLTGSLRIGGQFVDFYNDPASDSTVSPYVVADLRYFFAAESSINIGATHQRSASDIIGGGPVGVFVHDTEATTAYLSLTHQILPRLFGTAVGTFQYSTFHGGGPLFDGQSDRFYLLGLNFEYRFNPHFSAHAGYNYDRLDSDITTREFDRNRVYIGMTATY